MNVPKRRILGWQILLPCSQKAGELMLQLKSKDCCRIPSCLEEVSLLFYSGLQLIR